MKSGITPIVAVILVAGCGRSTTRQATPEVSAAQSNQIDLAQFTANIRQSVQEIDRNVVVGERTTDRIKKGLSELLSEVRIAVGDTNLVVNVNCGDPIYHITFSVIDGVVSDITVGLTPICYE